ncbi:M56 family metallopeptidase [Sedimentibacter sp.]|uniref:M56 family metallopeptidase n=1 Tax=Sedimentibacter sp. TaxID=1960295 RepID=UPI0028A2087F|nr:M56 family metallopeptidase [Sedimentibacter sp.]
MSSLFLTVLNMSLKASYAAVFVIIIRFFLKKAPKIFSYALWMVVLFRLMCPFSFKSNISLMPVNAGVIPENIINEYSVMDAGISVADNAVNNSVHPALMPLNTASGFNMMEAIIEGVSIVWIMGIIIFIIYGIASYLKLKNVLNASTLLCDNIFETDQIKTPFVLGIIRPKIYIPVDIPSNELNYIIKHEQTHIKRFDHIIKLISFFSLALHWFNPLIWLSFFLMSKDMEMSCDESVMRNIDEDIRINYSNSLLSLSVKQSGLLVPLAFGESNVKTRIKNILSYKKPSKLILAASVIIVVCIAVLLSTNPVSIQQYQFPLTSEDIESVLEEQGIDMYIRDFNTVDSMRNMVTLTNDRNITFGIDAQVRDGYKILNMAWYLPSRLTPDEVQEFFHNELSKQFELAGIFYGNKKGLDKELGKLLEYYFKEENYNKGAYWSKRIGNDHLRVSKSVQQVATTIYMMIMPDEIYEDFLSSTNEAWKNTAEIENIKICNNTVAEMEETAKEDILNENELDYFTKHFAIKGYLKNIKENKSVPEELINPISSYFIPNKDKYLSAVLFDATGSVDVFVEMTSLSKDELNAEREHNIVMFYNNGEPVYVVRFSILPAE